MTTPDFALPLTLEKALATTTACLAAANVGDAQSLARLALTKSCALTHAALLAHPSRLLGQEDAERLRAMVKRLMRHEPLSKILHEREFFGVALITSRHVLDPRPDSEILVEAALTRKEPRALLDLGIGSGALLVALRQYWKNALFVGVDRSLEACRISCANLARTQSSSATLIVCANWADALKSTLGTPDATPFDIILSNPPYLTTGELATLAPAVKNHDPLLALDGGEDGLDAYRAVFTSAARLLCADGRLFVEIGAHSFAPVTQLLAQHSLRLVAHHRDLSSIIRVLEIAHG